VMAVDRMVWDRDLVGAQISRHPPDLATRLSTAWAAFL